MGFKEEFQKQEEQKRKIQQNVEQSILRLSQQEKRFAERIQADLSSKYASKIASEQGIESVRSFIENDIRFECQSLINRGAISYEESLRICRFLKDAMLGYGPLEDLIRDEDISEILVLSWNHVRYQKYGIWQDSDIMFHDARQLEKLIEKIAQEDGKQINIMSPILDCSLPDGSRVNMTIPPVAVNSPTINIRKFKKKPFTEEEYVEKHHTLEQEMIDFLRICVRSKLSIIVSGGTGSGKTSFTNLLSNFIYPNEVIVTIEDTPELKLSSNNVIAMQTRISDNKQTDIRQIDHTVLVKNALRQNPDRIILGEVRGGEIVDLFSAMGTGHEGSISTIHANNPSQLCNVRIPLLYYMNENMAKIPEKSISLQTITAVHLIVQLQLLQNGRRVVTHISALTEHLDENDKIVLAPIFYYDYKRDCFVAAETLPERIAQLLGESYAKEYCTLAKEFNARYGK